MQAINAFLTAGFEVAEIVLGLYIKIIFLGVILSWLVSFNIINGNNRFVQMVSDFIYRITEPLLRPIRRILPPMGGLDFSPFVLMLIIYFVQRFMENLAVQYVLSAHP